MTAPIYIIASMDIHDMSSPHTGERRTWGWYSTLALAMDAVEENRGDMRECNFTHLIIEEVPEGFPVDEWKEWWYFWHPTTPDARHSDGMWLPCEKPDVFKQVINFTLG